MKTNMASTKSKGKRPIVEDNVGSRPRRKLTDIATSKPDGRARTNYLGEAERVKKMDNTKTVDVKVSVEKTRAMASKGKMLQTEKPLNKHGDELAIVLEQLKSVENTMSFIDNRFGSLTESLTELKQRISTVPCKGSYASPPKSGIVYGPFVCEICAEQKTVHKSFHIKGCSHAYCTDCMVKYVAAKLEENITAIRCPVVDCRGLLEPEYCRDILPQDVFDRWGAALCEAVIPGAQKFYCPFKDCSAMLIDDGEEVIQESECPNCRRLFCAQCQVPWHSGINCVEFQKLNKDEREREDILLMKVAQKEKWKRCPNCRYYVEKKDGCMYMKCRCGTAFCYRCGTASDKFNDQYHFCSVCKG